MGATFAIAVRIGAQDAATGLTGRVFSRISQQGKAAATSIKGVWGSVVNLKSAVVGLATGAAATKAVTMFSEWAAGADEVGVMAKQLGWTAEGLQEVRYAADLMNVPQETLNRSLDVFSRNLGQARHNVGPMAKGLAAMHPGLLKNIQAARSFDEALDATIAGLAGVTNEQERAAIAQAVFGKSGAAMNRFTLDGLPAFRKAREEARSMGQISNEAAAQAGDYGDAMDRAKASATGIANAIGSSLLPKLIPVVEGFTAWAKANREVIATRMESVARNIAQGMRWLVETGLPKLMNAITWISDNFAGIVVAGKAFFALWAASKVVGVVSGILSIARATQTLAAAQSAASTAGAVGGIGGMGAAVGLGIAGAAVATGYLVGANNQAEFKRQRGNAAFAGLSAGDEVRRWRAANIPDDMRRAAEGEIMSAASRTFASPDVLANPRTQADVEAVGKFWERSAAIYKRAAEARNVTLEAAERLARGEYTGGFAAPSSRLSSDVQVAPAKVEVEFKNAPDGMRFRRIDDPAGTLTLKRGGRMTHGG